MASRRTRTFLGYLRETIGVVLVLGLGTEAGLPAQQPAEKTRRPEERSERRDRRGDALPEGAIARLGTVLVQGDLKIDRAAFGLSPDRKRIVTFSKSRRVKFWDADTGKLREQRELPLEFPFQADLYSDGRLLAGRKRGFDTPLDVWDISTGKRLQRLQPTHQNSTYQVVFSPDGKMLAAAAAENVVYLWQIASGRPRELKGAGSLDLPGSLVFSPDSKLLIAAGRRSVLCWDATKGEQLWQTKGDFRPFFPAFTPDGRTLILASPFEEKGAWYAWDTATGRPTDRVKLPKEQKADNLAIAPDGRTLVFAIWGYVGPRVDRRIRIWDLREGKLLHTLPLDGDIGPFFPDGKSFLSNDGAVRRWELATGRLLFTCFNEPGHQDRVFHLVYSPDGRLLASASLDQTVRLWDVASAKPLHVLHAGRANVGFSMDFTPDGKFLVTGAIDDKLCIWDTKTGKVVRRFPLHEAKDQDKDMGVLRLRVTPDGRTLLVLEYTPITVDDGEGRHHFRNGYVSRWDLASGERKARDASPSSLDESALSPDGRLLVAGIELLDAATTKRRALLDARELSKFGGCYAFSANGRLMAGIIQRFEEDERRRQFLAEGVQVWEAATFRTVRCLAFGAKGEFRFTPLDFLGSVPLALSPDGRYVAAVDKQGLRVWELATGQVVLKRPKPESMRGDGPFARCLAFSPDGRTLATGNMDSTILIWKLPRKH